MEEKTSAIRLYTSKSPCLILAPGLEQCYVLPRFILPPGRLWQLVLRLLKHTSSIQHKPARGTF